MESLTTEQMIIAVKYAGTVLATLAFVIGAILGAVLEQRFDFWKW